MRLLSTTQRRAQLIQDVLWLLPAGIKLDNPETVVLGYQYRNKEFVGSAIVV
jgi:hypothetical protein